MKIKGPGAFGGALSEIKCKAYLLKYSGAIEGRTLPSSPNYKKKKIFGVCDWLGQWNILYS